MTNQERTSQIIACAIAVHKSLGPGFLESIYEEALAIEFGENKIQYERQKPVAILYRDRPVGERRLDFIVDQVMVVELKAVSELEPIFFSVVRSYLKATGLEQGLILNFATMPLTIKRVGRENSHRAESLCEVPFLSS